VSSENKRGEFGRLARFACRGEDRTVVLLEECDPIGDVARVPKLALDPETAHASARTPTRPRKLVAELTAAFRLRSRLRRFSAPAQWPLFRSSVPPTEATLFAFATADFDAVLRRLSDAGVNFSDYASQSGKVGVRADGGKSV